MITNPVPRDITARMMECIVIVLVLVIIFSIFKPFRIKRTGLIASPKDLIKTLIRGILISLGILAAFGAARLVMTYFNADISSRPWFKPYFNIGNRKYYFLIAIVQDCGFCLFKSYIKVPLVNEKLFKVYTFNCDIFKM